MYENITSVAKSNPSYKELLRKMFEKDKELMEHTQKVAEEMPILSHLMYSSIKWPVKLYYPLIEARTAFAVPNNYFQPLFINGGKAGVFFSHSSTRSVFFSENKLMIYSKNVNFKDGKEYFTSFVLSHFEKGEYEFGFDNKNNFYLRCSMIKPFRNLLSGEKEEKKISFNFIQGPIKNCIISKEQAETSTQFRRIYGQYSSAHQKLASSDMTGYVVTVPHFSPHPYMLQLHKDFGFESNKEFQENILNYFTRYLNLEQRF
ncbi:MAG: hypothetical protein WC501_03180 [Candidatus Micrarchaeia archaeon]